MIPDKQIFDARWPILLKNITFLIAQLSHNSYTEAAISWNEKKIRNYETLSAETAVSYSTTSPYSAAHNNDPPRPTPQDSSNPPPGVDEQIGTQVFTPPATPQTKQLYHN